MSINSIYFWMIVLVVAIAIEAISLNLTAIWFAVGALTALVFRTLGLSIGTQFIVFVIVSALSFILLRPFTKKILVIKKEKTNADRIVGEIAIVTLSIDNVKAQGQIVIFGQVWSARSIDGEIIEEGSKVKIISISGVKASVQKIN